MKRPNGITAAAAAAAADAIDADVAVAAAACAFRNERAQRKRHGSHNNVSEKRARYTEEKYIGIHTFFFSAKKKAHRTDQISFRVSLKPSSPPTINFKANAIRS